MKPYTLTASLPSAVWNSDETIKRLAEDKITEVYGADSMIYDSDVFDYPASAGRAGGVDIMVEIESSAGERAVEARTSELTFEFEGHEISFTVDL